MLKNINLKYEWMDINELYCGTKYHINLGFIIAKGERNIEESDIFFNPTYEIFKLPGTFIWQIKRFTI